MADLELEVVLDHDGDWFWLDRSASFTVGRFVRLDPCGPGRLRGGGFLHRLCLFYGSALLQETDLIISYEQ